ncbi:MAG: GGDEF domain-containing protein [Pseudomonas sp.]|uniref:sensor domain-containing diguanylate cyclase n=1 Tax=Pseudomonas sp. TaxID=306 RepID=UPI0033913D9B
MQIDDELTRQLLLFKAITRYSRAVIGAKDLQGRYIFVNHEFSRLFQRHRDHCIGRTDLELFGPEVARTLRRTDLKALKREEAILVEETAPVDGSLRHYLSVKFPVYDLSGQLFASGLVATDISQLKQLTEKLRLQAETDELTGVFNRRKLFEVGNREVSRALRYGLPLSLVMFDIDHFKAVNDRFGHATGDSVLMAFSQLVGGHLRRNDYFGRLGGEEFAVILPHTGIEQAQGWAERIVHLLGEESLAVNDCAEVQVTVSAGVAQLTHHSSFEHLLKTADTQLYRAKNAGRNCVRALAG